MSDVIDPQVASLLPILNDVFPKLGTEVHHADEARRLFDARRRPVEDPTQVGSVEEIDVAGADGATLPARLYRPLGGARTPSSTLRESVVFFHGGGWVLGNLDSHDELVRQLANSLGRTIVSVAYRLSPEHQFPGPLRDALAAVADLTSRSAELALDPPLIVSGDSAGGNLAALVALAGVRDPRVTVRAQLLLYPALDASRSTPSYEENATGNYITGDHLRWFWEQYLGPHADPATHTSASPLQCPDLTGAPPGVIVTAGRDPLRDEGIRYARRLSEAGSDVSLLNYPQAFHGFLGFARQLQLATQVFKDLGPALDRVMSGVMADG